MQQVKPRSLVATAAVLAAWMSLGGSALAHEYHDSGSDHPGAGHRESGARDRQRRPAHHTETYSFKLSGSQVPGDGDPDGRGRATLRLHPDEEVLCLKIDWNDLAGEVMAIHIHHAPEGQTGPHHIDILNDEHLAGKGNRVALCVQVTGQHHDGHDDGPNPADRIQEIIDDPADFYLNIHSTAFPGGAIRGELES